MWGREGSNSGGEKIKYVATPHLEQEVNSINKKKIEKKRFAVQYIDIWIVVVVVKTFINNKKYSLLIIGHNCYNDININFGAQNIR